MLFFLTNRFPILIEIVSSVDHVFDVPVKDKAFPISLFIFSVTILKIIQIHFQNCQVQDRINFSRNKKRFD